MPRTYDRDPYAILRVFPTATDEDVKEAYYKLARQYHPDLNTDPRAVDHMKDVNWAYKILSDPQERAEFDFWRDPRVQEERQAGKKAPRSSARPAPPYSPTPNSSQIAGRSQAILFWLAIMILMNVVLLARPVSHSNPNNSGRIFVNQAPHMQTLEPSPQTVKTPPGILDSSALSTPSPIASIPKDGLRQQDLRSSIVRGSWEWDQIHAYFPELTTLYGLSGEVTLVTYDQRLGYNIKTRGLGEYWIYIDPSTHAILPRHSPPISTMTPQP